MEPGGEGGDVLMTEPSPKRPRAEGFWEGGGLSCGFGGLPALAVAFGSGPCREGL